MGRTRLRMAILLLSFAVIGLELCLMRWLALRFWHHVAYMIVSVALLGFGAGGTILSLYRRWLVAHRARVMVYCCYGFCLSPLPLIWICGALPLNVQTLAWQLDQVGPLLVLECVMLVPFLLASLMLGLALMTEADEIPPNYAANLFGAGLGGLVTVWALGQIGLAAWLVVLTALSLGAALLLSKRLGLTALLWAGLWLTQVLCLWPTPVFSQYKMLPQVQNMPQSKLLAAQESAMGRIDVVAGPALHYAPGLSLTYVDALPAQAWLLYDGDAPSPVYNSHQMDDFAFLDQTTAAVGYHLRPAPRTLLVGVGGGSQIGLALYHRAAPIAALEMNHQVIAMMTGVLHPCGGWVYTAPDVHVYNREARGFLMGGAEPFDLIQLPLVDAFGVSGAGLASAEEAYLYTKEALGLMLSRLRPGGILAITRWCRTPPRDGIRVFNTARATLIESGRNPAQHLSMIRNWATVTVLLHEQPVTAREADVVRTFARARGFDLCYMPGLMANEVNQYHVLEQPAYFQAAQALLGEGHDRFVSTYPFSISATSDDRPYHFHTFRWAGFRRLYQQLGNHSRAFLELGYVLMGAALAQTVLLATVLLLVPLVWSRSPVETPISTPLVTLYFALLGAGFMLLEMSFLQKLVLYLAHPLYAAAVAIAAFLVFAGAGSLLGRFWLRQWPDRRRPVILLATLFAVLWTGLAMVGIDPWFGLTQSWGVESRFAIAILTIAPLAMAMGHLFPLGLQHLEAHSPSLLPWAWAVNGFAAVVATIATPLLAMAWGFRAVWMLSAVMYLFAAIVGRRLCR